MFQGSFGFGKKGGDNVVIDTEVTRYSTISDMKAVVSPSTTKTAFVEENLKGGLFYFDPASVETADDAIIIQKSGGGTGRWKRIISDDYIHVEWFGAKGDYNEDTDTGTNDTASILNAINTAITLKKNVIFKRSSYLMGQLRVKNWWDGFVIDFNGAKVFKTSENDDGWFVVAGSESESSRGKITIRNFHFDGRASKQLHKTPGSTGFPYPVEEYFGPTPISYGLGEYPVGTALFVAENFSLNKYISETVIENGRLTNWGKNGILATSRRLVVKNITAKKVLLHVLGVAAYNRANDQVDKRLLYVEVDGIRAEECGTCFDLSAGEKDDLNYYGECNVNNIFGFKTWINTKVSGAWIGNIDNLHFNDCGYNPSANATYDASGNNGKLFPPFKLENDIYRGINIGKITIMKSHNEVSLANAKVESIHIYDPFQAGIKCHSCHFNHIRIQGTNANNISIGFFTYCTIEELHLEKLSYDYETLPIQAIGSRARYPLVLGATKIDNIIVDSYSSDEGFISLQQAHGHTVEINGFRCLQPNTQLSKIDTYAVIASSLTSGHLILRNCDFKTNVLANNTSNQSIDIAVPNTGITIINCLGIGGFSGNAMQAVGPNNNYSLSVIPQGNMYVWSNKYRVYMWNKRYPTTIDDGYPMANMGYAEEITSTSSASPKLTVANTAYLAKGTGTEKIYFKLPVTRSNPYDGGGGGYAVAPGDTITIIGSSTGGWRLSANDSQIISRQNDDGSISSGAEGTGYIESSGAFACVTLKYIALHRWVIISYTGSLTFA